MKRIRTLLLLVLAYTGQTLAAVSLPCPGMSGADPAAAAAMAHAGHHVSTDAPAAGVPAATDCCDGGPCSMSHCQPTAALPASESASGAQFVALYPSTSQASSPFHTADPLYRPPISR